MAKQIPVGTIRWKPIVWIIPFTVTDGEIDGLDATIGPIVLYFNKEGKVSMPSASGGGGTTTTYIEAKAGDFKNFQWEDPTKNYDGLTGEIKAGGGSGGGDIIDKLGCTTYQVDPEGVVDKLRQIRNADVPCLFAMPHGIVSGVTPAPDMYYTLVGKLSSSIDLTLGAAVSELPIEFSGGKSYGGDSGDVIETATLTATAVAGDDTTNTVAGPSLAGIGAALAGGTVQMI